MRLVALRLGHQLGIIPQCSVSAQHDVRLEDHAAPRAVRLIALQLGHQLGNIPQSRCSNRHVYIDKLPPLKSQGRVKQVLPFHPSTSSTPFHSARADSSILPRLVRQISMSVYIIWTLLDVWATRAAAAVCISVEVQK